MERRGREGQDGYAQCVRESRDGGKKKAERLDLAGSDDLFLSKERGNKGGSRSEKMMSWTGKTELGKFELQDHAYPLVSLWNWLRKSAPGRQPRSGQPSACMYTCNSQCLLSPSVRQPLFALSPIEAWIGTYCTTARNLHTHPIGESNQGRKESSQPRTVGFPDPAEMG